MSSDPATSEVIRVGFDTLRLRPGMLLHAQPLAEASSRYDVQFLGIIEGKGVMVVPHGVLSLKIGMHAGQDFIMRGFTGQYDFSFASKIIRIFYYSYRDPPLAYVLLSYPETVDARLVRGALRVKACLPASISMGGDGSVTAATIIDLSVAGCLVNSSVALGVTDDQVNLAFSIDFENEKLDMAIPATIRRSLKSNSVDGFETGLLFNALSRNEKLMLYYFVLSSS